MKRLYGHDIDELAGTYGSPLFVASAEVIRDNVRVFRAALEAKYPNVEVAYSYKVNYLPGMLEIIHAQGAWAEVASGFEYEIAKKSGVEESKIVFNGPFKLARELETAVSGGALVIADHTEELRHLETIASKLRRPIDIGIRINTDVGIEQMLDRFGFNLESGEAARTVKRCADTNLLNIVCLHIHLTSYIIEPGDLDGVPAKSINLIWPKDARAYAEASEKIAKFALEISGRHGVDIKYLDLGGGFPAVSGITPYADALTSPILEAYKDSEKPVLILEPGRAIVANSVQLISTVVAVKDFPGGRKGVVIDSGINILPTSFWRYQDIEIEPGVIEPGIIKTGVIKAGANGELQDTTVYGPLCLQTDIVYRGMLPEVSAGDKIVIKNVGAYNIPQSSTFIFPQPAVVMIDREEVKIIRRAETADDVFLRGKNNI